MNEAGIPLVSFTLWRGPPSSIERAGDVGRSRGPSTWKIKIPEYPLNACYAGEVNIPHQL